MALPALIDRLFDLLDVRNQDAAMADHVLIDDPFLTMRAVFARHAG
jgi:hypothetical protein